MLKQRIITALILAPIALSGLFLLDPFPFSLFVGFVVLVGAWEWANLSGFEQPVARVLYSVCVAVVLYFASSVNTEIVLSVALLWWIVAFALVLSFPRVGNVWQPTLNRALIGILVLVPFWKALVFIRGASITIVEDLSALWVILYMLLLVWAADVGAYFAGKRFGKAKLAPNVSPGKSWAGAWGGLASVSLLSLCAAWIIGLTFSEILMLLIASVLAGVISIVGDLAESMFKRYRGIKDSSNLLPGHGGVMDRIDSLTAAVPVLTLVLVSFGWMA